MIEMDYETTLQGVRQWPLPVRVNFMQDMLSMISSEVTLPRQKRDTYSQALGLAASDDIIWTDEMVDLVIQEERVKKYGLGE